MVTFSVNYHHNMSEEVDKTYTYLLVVKFHTADGDTDEGIYVMKAHMLMLFFKLFRPLIAFVIGLTN